MYICLGKLHFQLKYPFPDRTSFQQRNGVTGWNSTTWQNKSSVFSLISMLELAGSMLVQGQRPNRGQILNTLLTVVTRNVIVIKTTVSWNVWVCLDPTQHRKTHKRPLSCLQPPCDSSLLLSLCQTEFQLLGFLIVFIHLWHLTIKKEDWREEFIKFSKFNICTKPWFVFLTCIILIDFLKAHSERPHSLPHAHSPTVQEEQPHHLDSLFWERSISQYCV